MNSDILEVEPGVFSILLDGVSYEVRVQAGWVSIDGNAYPFEPEDPRQWKRGSGAAAHSGRASIAAPMPGKVIRILASAGDEVQPGQGIVVIEAMKMQNELKAPRAGRISAIDVKPGDSVSAGATLATLE